jgi:hypothetical protein
VVAPTGIAAINAGGETLHSFLQLPFGPYLPTTDDTAQQIGIVANTRHTLLSKLRLRDTKINLLRKLELLIVDEVSMVRADLLDAADTVLRHVRKNYHEPFGGVQMLFIGDMYQLPPVVPQDEWELLSAYYPGLYFFDAQVMRNSPPLYLELTKIYRQKDELFIGMLNRIRTGHVTHNDIDILNKRYEQAPTIDGGYIVLCTHNQIADTINQRELQKLPTGKQAYEGKLERDFNIRNLPVDVILELKAGAQVMFVKNDTQTPRRYYNGKIGTIKSLTADEIYVTFSGESKSEPLKVEPETWKNIRYVLDSESGKIVEDELGSFSQYPLRLAWAITVHKSQGLTLEKVIVDLNRAFAPGQVYVALSRCTTLEGIKLASYINQQNIMVDPRVHQNMEMGTDEEAITTILDIARKKSFLHSVIRKFNFGDLSVQLERHAEEMGKRKVGPTAKNMELCDWLKDQLDNGQKHAFSFHKQVGWLFANGDYDAVTHRAEAGCKYFAENLLMPALQLIDEHLFLIEGASGVSKQVKSWKNLQSLIRLKLNDLMTTFA